MARTLGHFLIMAAFAGGAAFAQTAPVDVTDPSITAKPKPDPAAFESLDYPAAALQAHMEGEAKVSLCVEASGKVTTASVAKSSGHDLLDKATLEWAKYTKFLPAKAGDKAVAVCNYSLSYAWKLDPESRTDDYADIKQLSEKERPRLIEEAPAPAYPEKALADRVQGTVKLSLCIDKTGKVQTISFLTPEANGELKLATAKWAMASKFAPGKALGAARDVCGLEMSRAWKLP